MVCSLDGKTTVAGKAGSIGGQIDRALMRTLRSRADAVMVGAGTLRAEKLNLGVPEDVSQWRASRGLKPQPLSVIATASGDLPLRENLIGSSTDNLVVLASSDTARHRLTALSSFASVEIVPEGTAPRSWLDPTEALQTLKERHAVDVLLVEGGPALNYALVSAGLADELFLTLAPKLLGGTRHEALTMLEGPAVPHLVSPEPELISVYLSDNELFLRYTLRQIPTASPD
jgi:2,5-diamino-6-(ribosylamino)-4(3H)-pyrimidinone 5'-phosphate reductase